MNFWESVKRDLQKGLKEGIDILKDGATIVKVKAEELTEEGKKRYKIFDLKAKVQKEIAELGGLVYDRCTKNKNPMLDKRVKSIISRIKKYETRIMKLEGKVLKVMKKTKGKKTK